MTTTSRIETLRDTIIAAVELKQLAGVFCEPFEAKKTWFLCEDLEDSYDAQCEPIGTVWLCPRPTALKNLARHDGQTHVAEEEMTLNMTVAFPRTCSSEDQVGTHVRLVEELTDTIRQIAIANGYGFTKAEPARDDYGTPYLFINMEKGSFFTIVEFQFLNFIN